MVNTAEETPSAAVRAPLWATLTATFLGIGKLRPGPGTWASAATVLVWWAVSHWASPDAHLALVVLLAAL
ncbi:MAG TPA: hypothetical protein VH744_00195, partial [Terriglobales bacterium]